MWDTLDAIINYLDIGFVLHSECIYNLMAQTLIIVWWFLVCRRIHARICMRSIFCHRHRCSDFKKKKTEIATLLNLLWRLLSLMGSPRVVSLPDPDILYRIPQRKWKHLFKRPRALVSGQDRAGKGAQFN
jgi:hypothetical protein